MNRETFLAKCEETDLIIVNQWDIGSWLFAQRMDANEIDDLLTDWQSERAHETMAFMQVKRPYLSLVDAVRQRMVSLHKYGYVAELDIPTRSYNADGSYCSGDVYLQPVVYADTLEELWDVAISYAEDVHAKAKALSNLVNAPKGPRIIP